MQQEKEQLFGILGKHLKHLKADAVFDWHKPLKEYGLDSMSSINLLFDIEDSYGIIIPDEKLNGYNASTGTALLQLIEELKYPINDHTR